MNFEFVDRPERFAHYCDHLLRAKLIAFDTEFISEDCFRPELCLIQVVADGQLALIDGTRIGDCRPFWQALADGSATIVTHAARAEFLFSYYATGRVLERLFDVQIAAGLAGLEYPAAYSNLVQKLANESIDKTETRSDWRRRPLSPAQIEYALQDVVHLPRIHQVLVEQLNRLGRSTWMEQEMREWQLMMIENEINMPWRRLSGFASLGHRSMAIAAQLWEWRERLAQKRNIPARRVLRDDLLIELARREMSKVQQIKLLRGMERRNHDRDLPEIAGIISSAIGSPKDQWPERPPRALAGPDLNLLGQFLYSAFSIICRDLRLATSLVGTVQDVRKLAAWHLKLGNSDEPPPRLARGWRAEIVGETIHEMLQGKWAISINRPLDDQPLSLLAVNQTGKPAPSQK